MKLCIDCRHASAHGGTMWCKAPEVSRISPVDGTKEPPPTCAMSRFGYCGEDGKFFSPIDSGSETVNPTPGPIVRGQ